MITFSNYKLFTEIVLNKNLVMLLIFLGLFFAFKNIFLVMVFYKEKIFWDKSENVAKPLKVFLISFLSMVILNLSILFLCEFPGNLSLDSIDQLGQILKGYYTNHHPFYHTMIIKVFITPGAFFF
ncbi:MAG: hypothetical protein ACOX3T_03440 [Bdellovibrionota bacterium]